MTNAVNIAKQVIRIEIDGLLQISQNLNESFQTAVDKILQTKGRTIVCGMGKSGIIGKKMVASLASTGTPSYFMHPGEAFHGDLGMVQPEDVFIAISNSGETDEVLKLLPFLRDNRNYIIAITGNAKSTLSVNSHCHLDVSVPQEACPHQLAPTSSTTATLVLGDALTVALMEARQFKPENFARFHPGGSLGRRLLGKVRDEMVTDNLPFVDLQASAKEIISIMTRGGLGLALVVDSNKRLLGIITDGDLRRHIDKSENNFFNLIASDIYSCNPHCIKENVSIQSAIDKMTKLKINSLVVIFESGEVCGVINK